MEKEATIRALEKPTSRRWASLTGRFVFFLAFISLPTLLGAWRLDWWRGWFLTALMGVQVLVNFALVRRYNPELLGERWKRRDDTKPFDKVFSLVYTASLLATFVVGGLDAGRFGWAPLPAWAFWPGLALHLLGMVPLTAALCTNRHLETTVRIQTDREHSVVSWGPYRTVRHPMYAGTLVLFPGWVLMLGSSWAFVPMAGAIVALVIRTALEDATLRRELDGYEAYARSTRFRLIPGVW